MSKTGERSEQDSREPKLLSKQDNFDHDPKLMPFEQKVYERNLGRILERFDQMLVECPELIVKPDLELLRLADELVEGVE